MGPEAAGARAAFVLAMVSFVVPFLASGLALSLASRAKREIRFTGGRLRGYPMATAAQAIAWANIAIFGMCVLVLLGTHLVDANRTASMRACKADIKTAETAAGRFLTETQAANFSAPVFEGQLDTPAKRLSAIEGHDVGGWLGGANLSFLDSLPTDSRVKGLTQGAFASSNPTTDTRLTRQDC